MRTLLQRSSETGIERLRPGVARPFGLALMLASLAAFAAWPVAAQETLSAPLQAEAESGGDDAAEAEAEARPETEAPPATDVELDALLKLPNPLDFREERKGGAGQSDWRRRFREGQDRIATAKRKLAQVDSQLDEAAESGGSQWQMAPPGQQSSGEVGPLSFKLREDLRRARAEVEEAERAYRALEVEADLAGVPASWRTPET